MTIEAVLINILNSMSFWVLIGVVGGRAFSKVLKKIIKTQK